MTPSPNKTIGPYTLIDLLGKGSMGAVYRAFHSPTRKHVALKTTAPDELITSERRNRFFREARLAAELKHPGIIHIYEVGEHSRQLYIAMELLSGKDLKAKLETRETIQIEQKLEWMKALLDVFSFAHDKGIIHRDIKPSNIWIRPDQRLVVMDFGIARPLDSNLTRSGIILGTPDYISPEQILSIRQDQRTDIFLLGLLFYELFTGVQPFHGDSQAATAHNLLNEQPLPPNAVNPAIPQTINEMILRALKKDMNQRYSSCKEMLEILNDRRL